MQIVNKKGNKRILGQKMYDRARELIPGATQLYGKRQEMTAPGQWPAYFAQAQGCETVDVDGNHYIDMSMAGIGATLLGYADPDVTKAVIRRVRNGCMSSLNPPDEVELAELMMELHPWAQMVRFGRLGGESMTIAVRIARAYTGRDAVAFCGYHGWHDWYLAANLPVDRSEETVDRLGGGHLMPGLEPAGVPSGLAGTAMPFTYNRIEELRAIVDRQGPRLAAIVMEPTRNYDPDPGFLEEIRELATRCGACLIMDEITIGWRLWLGGAHLKYGLEPDMAVFAKTTGNGHPISAVVGRREIMQAAQNSFISSALWTEAVGPTAALATIRKFQREDVRSHVARIGEAARQGLKELGDCCDVPFGATGHPALTFYHFDHPEAAALQTLWTVRMLDRGFLVAGGFYPTFAHQETHVEQFLEACEPVFQELAEAIQKGDIEPRIGGPVKHTGFRRLV